MGREGYGATMMNWMYNHSFIFSISMITLEIVLGVALLTGWNKKGITMFTAADVVLYF
jgi:hypothetical protein